MATVKKNLKVDLLEYNEGQLSFIDEATNKQVGLPRNPRFIRDTRFEALKKSIEDAPEMLDLREILVYTLSGVKGKNGKYVVIGGNMRLRACKEIGYAEVPCKILDINTPMEKLREYAIKDNEAFGQNDFDILANEWDMEELVDWGMEADYLAGGELEDFEETSDPSREGSGTDTHYSRKIEPPVYEITGKEPSIAECINTDNVKKMLADIDASSVSEEQKEMLRACAYRHAAIRFDNMAEYYAHQGPEMQRLMEDNALVIIDFDKAIEKGFVEMTNKLLNLIPEEELNNTERPDNDEE